MDAIHERGVDKGLSWFAPKGQHTIAPGDVTAELVWVGSGTRDEDYEGKDVAGKIVLATGYGGAARFELVNFVDSKRTVSDIRNALSAEFGPVSTRIVARYLEDLVRVGVMKWK